MFRPLYVQENCFDEGFFLMSFKRWALSGGAAEMWWGHWSQNYLPNDPPSNNPRFHTAHNYPQIRNYIIITLTTPVALSPPTSRFSINRPRYFLAPERAVAATTENVGENGDHGAVTDGVELQLLSLGPFATEKSSTARLTCMARHR